MDRGRSSKYSSAAVVSVLNELTMMDMRCQVGKKHPLFTYMSIIFSLIGVIFYHIGTI